MKSGSRFFIAGICLLTALAVRLHAAPELSADPDFSDTGHYSLSWKTDREGQIVEIQESEWPDFGKPNPLYLGIDTSKVISGKLDGTYYYRARYEDGPWSQAVEVTVKHHGMGKTLIILCLGAIVFLATAFLIIFGHLKYRRELKTQS